MSRLVLEQRPGRSGPRLFRRPETGSEPPLSWRPIILGDGSRTARVVCSNGHSAWIDDHEIAADGTVEPSLECPVEGCDFPPYVRLQGWNP